MENKQVTDTVYPSETIDLPSKGLFYPKDSPLSSGQIDIKYMTAKEEDILTSSNLIQKGIVLDKLMDSLIVTKGVKSSDLLTGDLNAVMVACRILGYGKDYSVSLRCPSCGNEVDQTVDLTELTTKNAPDVSTDNKFTIVLPISKAEVELKLLTRADELDIDKETKALKKANGDVSGDSTSRLRAMIRAVNGDSAKTTIWKFVETLLIKDVRYLREQYREHTPDVDFVVSVDCDCASDKPKTMRLPIGTNFFWPDSGV
jgi:hypothetical protein